jgi:hypothetical protein
LGGEFHKLLIAKHILLYSFKVSFLKIIPIVKVKLITQLSVLWKEGDLIPVAVAQDFIVLFSLY